MQPNNQVNCQLHREKPFEFLLWSNNQSVSYKESSFGLLAEWCQGYLQGTHIDQQWLSDGYATIVPLW